MDMTRDSTTAPVMPPDPMHECKGVDSTRPKLRLGTSNAALHGEVEPGVRTAVRRAAHTTIAGTATTRARRNPSRCAPTRSCIGSSTRPATVRFRRHRRQRCELLAPHGRPRRNGWPSISAPAIGLADRFRRHLRPPVASTGRAPGATRSDPAETPARRGSNIRRIGGAALISRPRKCSVLRPVRVKLRQAAFNNDIFANLAHTTRG